MIYFISDLHLSHKNIIKYCNRPFATVDQMNSALIHNWNSVVKPEDTIYFLGDFALGPKEFFRMYSAALNGHKMFVFGNHDHISHDAVIAAGWEDARYRYDIEIDGTKLHIEHHPTSENVPEGAILVYGHVHDKPLSEGLKCKSVCVCAELINYTPISFEDMMKRIVYPKFDFE